MTIGMLRVAFKLLLLSIVAQAQTSELTPLAIVERAVEAAGGEAWARP